RDTISRVTDAVLRGRRGVAHAAAGGGLSDRLLRLPDGPRARGPLGSVSSRACYLAIGQSVEGDREVLGIWWQQTEGAKFWLAVLNDLQRRGVEDVLIACVDGLTG